MARNRASMKEEVLFNLGGSDRVPDGLLNEWFGKALEDIQRAWRFGQQLTSSVLTVTVDTPTVSAPTSFGLMGIRGEVGPLDARSFYYARKAFLDRRPRTTGYPSDYWLEGSTIYFHPEPVNETPDDWVDSTLYEVDDLVADTTNGREYVCLVEHTGDGAASNDPLTDTTNWELTWNGDFTCYYLSQDTLTSDEDSSAIDLVDDALIWMVTARGFVSVGEPEQALMYAGMARAEVKKARVWDSERYAKVWSIMGVSRHQVDFIGTDR